MKSKMIVVKQSDIKDCGPCCLQSIIRYYGGYVSLEKIREDCNTTMKGTTVYHLIRSARKYGFDAMAKKYLDKSIEQIKLPAIIHVHYDNGLDHFMCLYEIKNNKLFLMDPAKGKIVMTTNDFYQIFTGVTIELSPKNEIVYISNNTNLLNLFFKIIIQNKEIVFKLLLSSMLLIILTIIYSFYFKFNYNLTTSISNIRFSMMVLFLLIVLFRIVVSYLKAIFENDLNKNIDISLLNQFLNHIFSLPLRVINNKSTGEIITRINELYNLKDLFSQIFINLFVEFILALGAFVIVIYISPKLTIIVMIMLLLYILFALVVNSYLYQRINQNIDIQTEFNAKLIDNINMINSYKNLNIENKAKNGNSKNISKLINDNYELNGKMNVINLIKNSILEIGIFILNTYGFYLIWQGRFSFIDLVLINNVINYLIEPIQNTVNILPKINYLRASYLKICDFIDINEEKLGKSESFVNGDIEFNNVSFSYNYYVDNLKNVSFKINQGEKVLLNGKSGCGKSTICALLEKIYNPSSGTISIGGKNILDYSISTIRHNITYVSQKEALITGTIKDNILFNGGSSKNYDLVNKICLVEDIVSKKKFRYESGIDGNYSDLSGGEKQRIILARALLKNSSILLLDEALSEVDSETEKKIIYNIMKYYPHKTIVYISHKNHEGLFDRVINLESVNNL